MACGTGVCVGGGLILRAGVQYGVRRYVVGRAAEAMAREAARSAAGWAFPLPTGSDWVSPFPAISPVPMSPISDSSSSESEGAKADAEQCDDRDPVCDDEFIGEAYWGGDTKTCRYQNRSQMYTFPQDVGLPCMPVNPKTCMVDTSTFSGIEVGLRLRQTISERRTRY